MRRLDEIWVILRRHLAGLRERQGVRRGIFRILCEGEASGGRSDAG